MVIHRLFLDLKHDPGHHHQDHLQIIPAQRIPAIHKSRKNCIYPRKLHLLLHEAKISFFIIPRLNTSIIPKIMFSSFCTYHPPVMKSTNFRPFLPCNISTAKTAHFPSNTMHEFTEQSQAFFGSELHRPKKKADSLLSASLLHRLTILKKRIFLRLRSELSSGTN